MTFRVPISACPILLDPLFVLPLFWMGVALGYRVFKLLGVRTEGTSLVERGVLMSAIGMGLLQFVGFGLSCFGLLKPTPLWIALGVVSLVLFPDMIRVLKVTPRLLQQFRANPPPTWLLLGGFVLVVAIVLRLPVAFAPATDLDGVGYHLTSPKRWLDQGKIHYLPTIPHANNPMGLQMLYSYCLGLWSETSPKLVHVGFGCIAVLATYCLGARLYNRGVGFAAAGGLLFGLPLGAVLGLFGTAYVDLGYTAQMVCAVLAWFIWERERSRGWFLAAALVSGLVVSFKMTGLFIGFSLAVCTLLSTIQHKESVGKGFGRGLTLMGISILPPLPWFINSMLMTGNPVYPMLSTVFPTRDWDPDRAKSFMTYFRYFGWGQGAMLKDLTQDERGMLLAAGIVMTLGICIGLFFYIRSWNERYLLIVLGVLFSVALASTGFYTRYLMPILPIAYIFVLGQIKTLWEGRTAYRYASVAAILLLGVNALGLTTPAVFVGELSANMQMAVGKGDRSAYIGSHFEPYPLVDALNRTSAPDARLLGTSSFPFFYLDRWFIMYNQWQKSISMDSWENFVADLKKERITHVTVAKRYYPENLSGVSAPQEAKWIVLLIEKYGDKVAETADQRLYSLRPFKE